VAFDASRGLLVTIRTSTPPEGARRPCPGSLATSGPRGRGTVVAGTMVAHGDLVSPFDDERARVVSEGWLSAVERRSPRRGSVPAGSGVQPPSGFEVDGGGPGGRPSVSFQTTTPASNVNTTKSTPICAVSRRRANSE
jgi:hypothetical protein